MGNIIDYLKWRGDLTFQADAFNEVDNLLLSYLSYVNFDAEIPGVGQPLITIRELAERFFQAHSRDELALDKSFVREAPDILRAMAESKRFQDAMIGSFVNALDANRVLQMCAFETRLPDGTVYVSFKGTDDHIFSWKEDFLLALGEVSAHAEAVRYLNSVIGSGHDAVYRIGGHSKGGHLAAVAAAYCESEKQQQIKEIYCNDSPGFQSEFFLTEEYQNIHARIQRIIPNESFVGMLLGHEAEPVIIKSDIKGIMQHSGSTWQVLGNRFVRENELNGLSLVADEAMKQWLDLYDNEERIRFINDVFSVLEAPGVNTMTELQNGGLQSLTAMKKQWETLEPDTKCMIDKLLRNLFQGWTGYISERLGVRHP